MREIMMRNKLSGVLVVAAMAFAMIVGTSAKADAAFIAYICDDAACTGAGDIVVTDNTVGDSAGGLGAISINGTVGGLSFVSNVSQSKPGIGSATAPELDINFAATGTGTAWLYASDTGFTLSPASATLLIGGTAAGTNTLTSNLWGGNSNTNLDLSHLIVGPMSGITNTLSGPLTATANPYSLTLGIKIERSGSGTTTGDLGATLVPEPATMALFGLGMLGFGVASRRRRAARG
jgi:PEP-CTERM motif-containing protein